MYPTVTFLYIFFTWWFEVCIVCFVVCITLFVWGSGALWAKSYGIRSLATAWGCSLCSFGMCCVASWPFAEFQHVSIDFGTGSYMSINHISKGWKHVGQTWTRVETKLKRHAHPCARFDAYLSCADIDRRAANLPEPAWLAISMVPGPRAECILTRADKDTWGMSWHVKKWGTSIGHDMIL